MKDNPESNCNVASDSQECKSESENRQSFDAQIENFLRRADEAFKKVQMLSTEIHGSKANASKTNLTNNRDPGSGLYDESDFKHNPADTSGSQDFEDCEDDGDTAEYLI